MHLGGAVWYRKKRRMGMRRQFNTTLLLGLLYSLKTEGVHIYIYC